VKNKPQINHEDREAATVHHKELKKSVEDKTRTEKSAVKTISEIPLEITETPTDNNVKNTQKSSQPIKNDSSERETAFEVQLEIVKKPNQKRRQVFQVFQVPSIPQETNSGTDFEEDSIAKNNVEDAQNTSELLKNKSFESKIVVVIEQDPDNSDKITSRASKANHKDNESPKNAQKKPRRHQRKDKKKKDRNKDIKIIRETPFLKQNQTSNVLCLKNKETPKKTYDPEKTTLAPYSEQNHFEISTKQPLSNRPEEINYQQNEKSQDLTESDHQPTLKSSALSSSITPSIKHQSSSTNTSAVLFTSQKSSTLKLSNESLPTVALEKQLDMDSNTSQITASKETKPHLKTTKPKWSAFLLSEEPLKKKLSMMTPPNNKQPYKKKQAKKKPLQKKQLQVLKSKSKQKQ